MEDYCLCYSSSHSYCVATQPNWCRTFLKQYTYLMDFTKLKGSIPQGVIDQLPDTCSRFDISNVLRLCHFLSQCSHESINFTAVRENLNYSAKALLSLFGRYFDEDTISLYARHPEKIANRIYANRMGNGDEVSGDGWKYRGRGYVQLTGKNNYKGLANYMNNQGILSNPDIVATTYPLSSAGFYFWKNSIFPICDKGSSHDVVAAVTKLINGGVIGLADRIVRFDKLYKLYQ